MDDTLLDWDPNWDPDWTKIFDRDFGACEPAGTEASGPEGRLATVGQSATANTEHWQPIIGPGSIATDYVALTNVTHPPPSACVPPYVDFHSTATGVELPAVDTELELAATSNAEPSPAPATLSDLGDQADEVHSSVLDSLEGCTCLACVQERHPSPDRVGDPPYFLARCRIPQCTFLGTYTTKIPYHLKYHASRTLYRHERSHFEHQGRYKCAENGCGRSAKEFRGLIRHYQAKHCTKVPEFPCNVLGCNYGGENGFHRKDKLASHYKNMHQGRVTSVAHHRNILPAPAKHAASNPGTGKSSQ